jgi:hypothetical protein
MFDQQLDFDGNRHDLAPAVEQPKLFDSAPQMRGQIALDTDRLDTPGGVCEREAWSR